MFGNTSKTYYYSCLSLNCSAMLNLDMNIMLWQCINWVNHVIYLYSGFDRGWGRGLHGSYIIPSKSVVQCPVKGVCSNFIKRRTKVETNSQLKICWIELSNVYLKYLLQSGILSSIYMVELCVCCFWLRSVSCVPNVASVSGLFDFVLCLVCPMSPVFLDYPVSGVPNVASVSGLSCVLCAQCCQCFWIVHSRLTFIF